MVTKVSRSSMAMNLRSNGAPGYKLPSRRRVNHCVQAATGRRAAGIKAMFILQQNLCKAIGSRAEFKVRHSTTTLYASHSEV